MAPDFGPSVLAVDKVHYAFGGTDTDGYKLYGGLALHGRDVLYGTTTYGGQDGFGTVFQLVPPAVAGGAWTENVLYNFVGQSDGVSPSANVIFDKAGNLYGTTEYRAVEMVPEAASTESAAPSSS
ncbi:MAG: choice-of-anchor tandem repeat GloVer-containing protein [Candidatus Sulfotelmatobacter sp.]